MFHIRFRTSRTWSAVLLPAATTELLSESRDFRLEYAAQFDRREAYMLELTTTQTLGGVIGHSRDLMRVDFE